MEQSLTLNDKSILCLDVGTKSCGIAATDALGITVQPVANLKFKGLHQCQEAIEQIEAEILERTPSRIVYGLPLNMDGTRSPQIDRVESFINQLKNQLKRKKIDPNQFQWIPFDERKTSEVADAFLVSQDVTRKKRKAVIDKMAAVVILKSYLEEFDA